jgi:hypothetical protein
MKKLLALLLLTTTCLGQRYESWTQNSDGTTSYTTGRIIVYRDIDAELRASEQASWNMYLRVVERGHKQTQDYIDKIEAELSAK